MGHTLNDVANEVGHNLATSCLFVHQMDPTAIDIDKVSHYKSGGIDHKLQFPKQLREDWVLAPLEVGVFDKQA